MQLGPRLGSFFLWIGLFLLLLFVGSIITKDTSNGILLPIALISLVAGFLLRRKKPASSESGRFGMIHKINERSRQRREEKSKPKK